MMFKFFRLSGLIIAFIAILSAGSTTLADTTLLSTFTYQGFLSLGGNAVTSPTCDFEFGLFSTTTGGTALGGGAIERTVSVSSGVFTAQLDFGTPVFDGQDRYLEIGVLCPSNGGNGPYTLLSPRSPITPTPYAMHSINANELVALRVQYNATSPNLIGGFSGNSVGATVVGATIGGGGTNTIGTPNVANGNYATVSGGSSNTAGGAASVVGGGEGNAALSLDSVVAGGSQNTANEQFSTVVGGFQNYAGGPASFVGGGRGNRAMATFATIAGGGPSDVGTPTTTNNIATDDYTTIGGGGSNQAGDAAGTATDATYATVGGGENNTASGSHSMIPGGLNNTASGNSSFAAGNNAQAVHDGAFVWADSTGGLLSSTGTNQFIARASSGFFLYTNSTATLGATLPLNDTAWAPLSDRDAKTNILPVDSTVILQQVVAMPISTWNYITPGDSLRHIGPMAQDFYTAFGVGMDDKHISTIDADGVALAAIQGLYQVVQDKDAEIASLQAENETLKTRLDDLDQRLAALEAIALPSQAGLSLPVIFLALLATGSIGFVGRRFLRQDA
jgi:trimeric autotransporter adhesin